MNDQGKETPQRRLEAEMPDGTRWDLGNLTELQTLATEVQEASGGSSNGGGWSVMFGLLYGGLEVEERGPLPARIAEEAQEMETAFGDRLSPASRAALQRIAAGPRRP